MGLAILKATGKLIVGTLLVALIAGGIPLAWVWVGSQVQGGTEPSATAIATVVTGMIASYGVFAVIAAALKGRSQAGGPRRDPAPWNRSMRDARYAPPSTTFLENVLIVATILVGVIVVAWFFLFGSPGVPIT